MGMDVYGVAPKSEVGEYFRASIWSWRPIHEMIEKANVLPQDMVEEMSFNDGAGPNEEQALLLAAALENMVEGMDDDHEFLLTSEVQGAVAQAIKVFEGMGAEIYSPNGLVYSTDVLHIREFIDFCRASGGFQVW